MHRSRAGRASRARSLACALVAGADAIVTNNIRDFPDEALASLSIEVIRLDDFLLDLFDLAAEEFAAVDTRTGRRLEASAAVRRGSSQQSCGRGRTRYCR